ncbi:MAG: hypothetical protein J6Y08_03520 [Clostridiales bacterium]|nr:hypothetical protein [Clostridiales bacterium]
MKKLVAILLSLSFVLACACTSETEETKKKKKKKKTEKTTTEETTDDTEPSESPTETEETTTEPTTTAVPISTDFVITDGILNSLECYYSPYFRSYGELDANDTDEPIFPKSVQLFYDDLYISVNGFDELDEMLYDVFGEKLTAADEYFDEKLDDMMDEKEAGKPMSSAFLQGNVTLMRADSQIFSFAIEETYVYEDLKMNETYNYRSEDGSEIALTDVVVDLDAFADYVESYLANTTYSASASTLKNDIKIGNANFLLSYDAIFLEDHLSSNYMIDYIKIPVYDLVGVVDFSYFGSTPSYYTLFADANDTLVWDFDGDGTLDVFTLTATSNQYDYLESISIDYNGSSYKLDDSLFEDLYGGYDTYFFMQTDTGLFLYINCWEEDGYSCSYCFKMNDMLNPEYITFLGIDIEEYPCDPDFFRVGTFSDVGGTTYLEGYYSIIGCDGIPENIDSYSMRKSGVLVTNCDLVGTDADDNEVTIPAGTSVSIRAYNPGMAQIVVEILHVDDSENEYVYLDVQSDSWPITIAGVDQQDAFIGLFFAG